MSSPVTVVIPTFRRPEALARALDSVLAQHGAGDFNVLVVDNDPAGSAKQTVEAAASLGEIRLTYLHEPRPGVANARNAAISGAQGTLIAFLDDDQTAADGWLAALLDCHRRFPAAVTFGPVRAALPSPDGPHASYLADFFSRPEIGATGYTPHSFGCGNALIDLAAIPASRPVFDERMNETGGEDDLLFDRVSAAGGRFAWCAEAVAYEHVPASRASLRYTLHRALAYGQGPITLARQKSPVDWPAIAMWMGVGAAKLAGNGALYAVGWLTRSPRRAFHLDRAARGLGKLVWWVRFRFYGAAQL